jgi:Helix-turn-helix domain
VTAKTSGYLDEAATARLLNVGQRTLQRWRSTGDGPPFIRAGVRRILYSSDAIEVWAQAHTFAHRAAELTAS